MKPTITQVTARTQQRNILAHMGIDCWVRKNSKLEEIPTIHNTTETTKTQIILKTTVVPSFPTRVQDLETQPATFSDEPSNNKILTTIEVITKEVARNEDITNIVDIDKSVFVSPFTLQGVQYGNWVLLIDEANLSELAKQLWQKIYHTLSLNLEQLKFPIYEGMTSVELANATLAGFVFKLVKREEIKIGSLTALAEGLDDKHMIRLPSLEEMVTDPILKQKFWHLINN